MAGLGQGEGTRGAQVNAKRVPLGEAAAASFQGQLLRDQGGVKGRPDLHATGPGPPAPSGPRPAPPRPQRADARVAAFSLFVPTRPPGDYLAAVSP